MLSQENKQISGPLLAFIMIMGAFGVMGGGLVAPGLPAIGSAFSAPEEQLGLILSVYTISAAISLPLIGYFIDTVGRRRTALVCLIIDGTAGIGSSLAPTFSILLGWRFLQGIGVAGLIPIAMTVIGDCFQGKKRLKYMGFLTGTISLGAVIIPSLGGFLAAVDWRLVFMVYALSLVLALIFFFKLPETAASTGQISLNKLRQHLVSLFNILKLEKIRLVLLQSFAAYFFLYAMVTFLPVYIFQVHGLGEIFSGLSLSLQGLISAIFASRAGFFAGIIGWRKRTVLGFILIAMAFMLLPFWPEESYLILLSMIIYGSGMGILNPTIYDRITGLPPEKLRGSVISLFNTLKYLGMSSSPLLLGFLLIFFEMQILFFFTGITAALWGIVILIAG